MPMAEVKPSFSEITGVFNWNKLYDLGLDRLFRETLGYNRDNTKVYVMDGIGPDIFWLFLSDSKKIEELIDSKEMKDFIDLKENGVNTYGIIDLTKKYDGINKPVTYVGLEKKSVKIEDLEGRASRMIESPNPSGIISGIRISPSSLADKDEDVVAFKGIEPALNGLAENLAVRYIHKTSQEKRVALYACSFR